MHLVKHLPHRLRKQTPFIPHLRKNTTQRDVIMSELGTCVLSLVTGSWLFHNDYDNDANFWQLGLFAKIGRCVSRFITIIKGVYVCHDNIACFRRLPLSKFSGSIGLPAGMRAQFLLIIKYVAGLHRSTQARRIARIKYAIVHYFKKKYYGRTKIQMEYLIKHRN